MTSMSSSSSGPTMLTSLGSTLVEAITGEGASIRHGAFIRGEHLIQTLYLKGSLIRYEAFI